MKRSIKRFLTVLLAVIMVVGTCQTSFAANAVKNYTIGNGKVYFMAPWGDDKNVGSIDAPFATFPEAIAAMEPGDVLYLRGGVYYDAGMASSISGKQGDANNWFTVLNYPGEKPIIDGEFSDELQFGISLGGASYWHIEGIEIRNFQRDGVGLYRCNNIELVNLNIHDISQLLQFEQDGHTKKEAGYDGITVMTSENILIEGCEIYDIGWSRDSGQNNLDHGIYIQYESKNVVVKGCYFHDIPDGCGTHAYNGQPENIVFTENLFVNCMYGAYLGGNSSNDLGPINCEISNNTFWHSSFVDVQLSHNVKNTVIKNNIFGPMLPEDNWFGSRHVINVGPENCTYDGNFYDDSLESTHTALMLEIDADQDGNADWSNPAYTWEDIQALGWEANGQVGEVKFTDPDNGDFTLVSGNGGMTNAWAPVEANGADAVSPLTNYSFENEGEFWIRNRIINSSGATWSGGTPWTRVASDDAVEGNYVAEKVNTGNYPVEGIECGSSISVKGNTSYTLTVKVKTSAETAADAKAYLAYGGLYYPNAPTSWENVPSKWTAENGIEYEHCYVGNTLTGPNTEWTTLKATFTTPDVMTHAKIILFTEGAGTWYFDDVQLIETEKVPTVKKAGDPLLTTIFVDASFEDKTAIFYKDTGTFNEHNIFTGTVAEGTITRCNKAEILEIFKASGSSLDISETVGHTGSNSMHIKNVKDDVITAFSSQFMPHVSQVVMEVTGGATYDFSAKVLINGDATDASLAQVRLNAMNIRNYQHVPIEANGSSDQNVFFGPVTGKQTDWQTISGSFTVDENATNVSIELWAQGLGDFYFDDICVNLVEDSQEESPDDIARAAALDELRAYLATFNRADYKEWQWIGGTGAAGNSGIMQEFRNGIKNIKAATGNDITTALNNAKAAMDAIETREENNAKLESAVEKALKKIDKYSEDDYSGEELVKLIKLKNVFVPLIEGSDYVEATDLEARIDVFVEWFTSSADELVVDEDNGTPGPQGPEGPQGPQGEKGDKGDTGATGAQGEKGDKGDTGATGAQGEKGDKGDTGATGAQGEKGDKGDTGATGAQGATGAKGDKGDAGAAGADGQDGKDGVDGKDGKDGVGIADIKINEKGEFIFTMTDGSTINAGTLPIDQLNLSEMVSGNVSEGESNNDVLSWAALVLSAIATVGVGVIGAKVLGKKREE